MRGASLARYPCPVCGGDCMCDTAAFEGYVEGWRTQIAHCELCQVSFSTRRDVPEGLYDSIYRQSPRIPGYNRYALYSKQVERKRDPAGWLAANEAPYRLALKWLSSAAHPRRILEFGSGLGYFTYALRQRGFDAVGMDLSIAAVEAARQRFSNADSYFLPAEVRERFAGGFDVVIGLEIIEHVPRPIDFVREAASYLRPGGSLFLSTPNRDALTATTVWDSDLPPVHLTWFGSRSFGVIADRVGASIEFVDDDDVGDASFPVDGSVGFAPPILDRDGHVTEAARRAANTTLVRLGILRSRLRWPRRAPLRPLPGVGRDVLVSPTSRTMGAAFTFAARKGGAAVT